MQLFDYLSNQFVRIVRWLRNEGIIEDPPPPPTRSPSLLAPLLVFSKLATVDEKLAIKGKRKETEKRDKG